MNENIIYCLKSFSLRDKIIFHKGESYEYIIEGKSHLTDDASVYVFYNKNSCMGEQGYRFYILGKNMDDIGRHFNFNNYFDNNELRRKKLEKLNKYENDL